MLPTEKATAAIANGVLELNTRRLITGSKTVSAAMTIIN